MRGEEIGHQVQLTVVGMGLAGCCLGWELLWKGADFQVKDDGIGGSSLVAAGLLNPITGRNFQPSWRIDEFHPLAINFYKRVETFLGIELWFPMPVMRLARSAKEWRKIEAKTGREDVAGWVVQGSGSAEVKNPAGFAGQVELQGGGRIDVAGFVRASQEFFREEGLWTDREAGVRIECKGSTWAAHWGAGKTSLREGRDPYRAG